MLVSTNVKLQLTLLSRFLLDLKLLVSTNYFKFDNLDNPLLLYVSLTFAIYIVHFMPFDVFWARFLIPQQLTIFVNTKSFFV